MEVAAGERVPWAIAPRVGEPERALLGVDSLLSAQLLWNRGVRTAGEASAFLDPAGSDSLADPWLMLGMRGAVDRLLEALRKGERIAVHGDYDVDGIAGAAVLVEALRGLGGDVLVHLPNRARDGYGINPTALHRIAAEGASLMVTVDCGISANREVELARDLGIDVVVTDHHTVPAQLPAACAVLNPHQEGCAYPFKQLSGGGVAFQVARALLRDVLSAEEVTRRLERLVVHAALSTVADIVPLTGENRTIVAAGLAGARAGRVPGLQALCELAGRPLDRLTADDLAFMAIPRLNAPGRMADPTDAFDLLVAQDIEEARSIAPRLEILNMARREAVKDLLLAIDEEACRYVGDGALVLAGDYPVGLMGLLAARLAERFNMPSVVIERGEEMSRGSARGVEGVHLVRALEQCASRLVQYGGHERAAGFTVRSEDIDAFRTLFGSAVRAMRGDQIVEPGLHADAGLRLTSIGVRLAELLDRFEPVGAGNPRPTFVSRGVIVQRAQELDGGHVRLRLAQGTAVCRGIAFRPIFPVPEPGTPIDILYEVERSWWRDEARIELVIRDARPAEVKTA